MKKNLFILAVAAFALASCSNDDTVAENVSFNESNAISFRTSVNGVTRAADQSASTLQANGNGFYVTARHKADASSSATEYFDNVHFTFESPYYTSTKKYYWPAAGTIDFFAYAPAVDGAQVNDRTDYLTYNIIPSSTVAEQVDFIYANTDGQSKSTAYNPGAGTGSTVGQAGVPLNFRHAESKIVIKVKNSADNNLYYEITGWKIANVDGDATFTYNDASNGDNKTDGTGTLLYGDWTDNRNAQTVAYNATFTANTITGQQATAYYINPTVNAATALAAATTEANAETINMILIPQQTTAAASYSNSGTAAVGDATTGSYIALKLKIQNTDANGVVVADATADNRWAIWPVDFNWEPGKKYTYTIDLAGGGYWETNNDADEALDPILENAVIRFVDVTVDEWSAQTDINVPAAPALP